MSSPSDDDLDKVYAIFFAATPDLEALCSRESNKYSITRQNLLIVYYTMGALLSIGALIWLLAYLYQKVHSSVEFSCAYPAWRIAMTNGAVSGNWQDSQSTFSELGRPVPTQTPFEACVQDHPAINLMNMSILITAIFATAAILKVTINSLKAHYSSMRYSVQVILNRFKFNGRLMRHIEDIALVSVALTLLTYVGIVMSTMF